jgi:hypothetical protein
MAIQDFGGLLFGGGGTGLEDYLTPEQQSGIQNQAMLQAAAALLQAGGPSPRRISLGQALGGALQAGAQGYGQAQQGAVQNLLVRQKLAEAKRQEDFRRALQGQQMQPQMAGGGEVTTITPDQAISMEGLPAGPTVARAAMIGQQVQAPTQRMSQQDMLYQDAINNYNTAKRYGYPEIASKYLEDALKIKPREEVTGDIFKSASGEYVQRTKSGQFIPVSAQFAPIEKPMGAPIKVTDSEGKQVLVNQMSDGTFKTVQGFGPARELIQVDRGGVITFMDKDKVPAGTSLGKTLAPQVVGGAESGYFQIGGGGGGVGGAPRPSGAPAPAGAPSAAPSAVVPAAGAGAPQTAPMAGGAVQIIPAQPKIFANEKDLRTEFQAQVKPYVELGQAYQKIETAAKNPSAAGDIALVYGFMKVLDPSSVVREGEFATAQNAGGIPDTVRNLYNKALDGQRLGEKIRSDFLQQARNLVESQRVMSNDLMTRYTDVAKNYKLDPNQVVFDPFKRIQTPEQIIGDATKTNIPTTRQEFFDRFNLKKPTQ